MKDAKFVPMRVHSNWTWVHATALTGRSGNYWIVPRYIKFWKNLDTCQAHCDVLNSRVSQALSSKTHNPVQHHEQLE